jgi:transglutaminase-like putative cysteine protease
MISRAVDALVAALATIAAIIGLTTLTENATWLGRAVWICLAVAAAGLVMRQLTSVRVLVLLGQLIVATWVLVAVFATDRLWYGLPGPDAWGRIGELVNECVAVMQRYAAPIPATEGVQLVFVAGVAGLAILVDFLAVTEEAPGIAGLPLLAAFLTAAANGGASLSPWFFVVAAVMWLVLVARQGRGRVQRWSTTVASLRTPTSEIEVENQVLWGYGNVARQLGVAAIIAAVVIPAVVPHLPTRYILDGLGRGDSSVGRGSRVGFNSTVDLSRSLQSGDDNIAMTYRTSAPSPPPLRIVVSSTYVGGQWPARPVNAPTQQLTQAAVVSSQVPVADRQLQVESNYVSSPHIASVPPVVSVDFGGQSWYADAATGDLYASDRPDSYSVTYREVDVTSEQLQAGIPGASSGRGSPDVQASTTVDAGIAAQLDELTDQVTAGTTSTYAAATAIQKWLRTDGGFSYNLQLPESVLDENGRQINEPILRFLKSKVGYCVQFATTMVMMARAKGIPARMALGYLPGRQDNGLYTVRNSDAHAWPELYFPGAGWLRFEPTPAVRTGAAPTYTVPSAAPAPSATTAPQTDSDATASATSTARDPGAPEVNGPATAQEGSLGDQVREWFRDPWHLLLVAVLLGLLGSLVLPLTAYLVNRRRRSRAATPGELAEAQWDELVSRLGDLGVPPPNGGGTLREWKKHYVREAYLDGQADEAMGHVVATLERSRYARPGAVATELADDVRTVTRSAATNRPWTQRIRAFFVPQDGVRWWTRSMNRIADAPVRWIDAAVDRFPRRG